MAYQCKKILTPLTIDGNLDKPQWKNCEKSPRFIDAIGGNPGFFDTRAALLWDDEALYVGFWSEEPYPYSTLTERDSLLWFENDVEVFIDGKDSYYELEMNARNTVYEVFYIWQDAYGKNPLFNAPHLDVMKNGAQTFGGNFDRTGKYFWRGAHPRGNRWAYHNWDFPGLETAVQIHGELNNPNVVSKGWTAEIKLPWKGFRDLSTGREGAPKAGDLWRILLARYETMQVNGETLSVGWSWDKIGDADNHYPEKFTEIQLSDEIVK